MKAFIIILTVGFGVGMFWGHIEATNMIIEIFNDDTLMESERLSLLIILEEQNIHDQFLIYGGLRGAAIGFILFIIGKFGTNLLLRLQPSEVKQNG